MARIGVYGGTFNPIHNTHIEIAKAALEQYKLDKVYFLVAGTPPHKNTAETISDISRLEMVKIAIADTPGLDVDEREIYRAGKSYSYLTFTEYHQEYPDDEIFFIMGSDSLLNFKNWVKPDIISEYTTILVAPRLGDDINDIEQSIFECKNMFDGDFMLIDYKANAIASSEIRGAFYKDTEIKSDVPKIVADYIVEHNLYSLYTYTPEDITRIDSEMKKELKPGRYIHTLGVANMAYSLAIKWNYPAVTAQVAGMLHDCAKCISDEKRLSVCEKNNIPVTDIERQYPHLLHGKVGAYYCKSKYDVYDEQIAHAIEVHTTGCPNMNLLDKIIFVADYIEPGRDKQPRLDVIRACAFKDLDLCVYLILEDTVNYLNTNPDMVDPTTIDTFEFYKSLIEKR
ncbi:nicotinate-nucleotide adenylyltransferase [Pseudobutyrivibrio sp. OR37]|uniref:nicotinate (nicotinamide) nucleotide adenylyltransferase n=1 Tax=Pseudobutyrivibrio sp. OR37 TaxID=1798186 RepID=UPI0008EBDD7B|nr:nicotinate (nicotinamide) nucleotide adenylyltransferase [Pseudobutyrivibrio sp. OR37]SFI02982.1 nicotinate-nucleotide adenylyltransferase [Pseudobutyrivibrio sp. OR37]